MQIELFLLTGFYLWVLPQFRNLKVGKPLVGQFFRTLGVNQWKVTHSYRSAAIQKLNPGQGHLMAEHYLMQHAQAAHQLHGLLSNLIPHFSEGK
jgi:hypothetical protein